jgi:hypothetical protein
MTVLKTSGDRTSWLNAVANRIMDGGAKPPSLDVLYVIVPYTPGLVTARNDGHVTAAENLGEDYRNDYRAGWKIIIDEMVDVLREQGFVNGGDALDSDLVWCKPLDGEWKVRLGNNLVTLRGQRERRLSRDRHILGERPDSDGKRSWPPGLIETGQSAGFKVTVLGERNAVRQEEYMVHPLAMLIPPMTAIEREALRTSIAEKGVRNPLILYPDYGADPVDKTRPRSAKPMLKVLDGRHRLYLASQLGKPVKVEVFEGTEKEAREEVILQNLRRRQLTVSQQNMTAVLMFAEEAKKEAKEAQEKGRPIQNNPADYLPPNSGEVITTKKTGEWTQRVVEKAKAAGLTNVTRHGVENIEPAIHAPETRAKVEAGHLGKVADAHQAAATELRIVPAPRGQDGSQIQSINALLGTARSNLMKILVDVNIPLGDRAMDEVLARVDELENLLSQIRTALSNRNDVVNSHGVRGHGA